MAEREKAGKDRGRCGNKEEKRSPSREGGGERKEK